MDFLTHVEARDSNGCLTASRIAFNRKPRQTTIPAIDRIGIVPAHMVPKGIGIEAASQRLTLRGRNHVQRRRRRTIADSVFHTGDPERIARIPGPLSADSRNLGEATDCPRHRRIRAGAGIRIWQLLNERRRGVHVMVNSTNVDHILIFDNAHVCSRHRRNGPARQWNDRWRWCACHDFSIRQRAVVHITNCRSAVADTKSVTRGTCKRRVEATDTFDRNLQFSARLECIMNTPHLPHALGKVRVEVTMENGVAGCLVTVAGTTKVDPVSIPRAWPEALCVEVIRVIVVRVEQPLVIMQVEYMLFTRTGMQIAERRRVTDIAVVNIGRVFGIQDVIRLRSRRAAVG